MGLIPKKIDSQASPVLNVVQDRYRILGQYYLVIILVLIFFIPAFIHTVLYAGEFCRADDWRYIENLLIPYYNGEFHWKDLWWDNVHPLPLKSLSFILNAQIFQLDMWRESMALIMFQFFFGLAVVVRFSQSYEGPKSSMYSWILILTCFIFIFSHGVIYRWSLVAQGYVYVFLFILELFLIDRLIRRVKPTSTLWVTMTSMVLLMLNLDLFMIGLFALIVVLFFVFIDSIRSRKNTGQYFSWIVGILLSITVAFLLLRNDFSSVKDQDDLLNGVWSAILNPIVFATSFSDGILSILLDETFQIRPIVSAFGVAYEIGGIIFFIVYIYILIEGILSRRYRVTIVPYVLMIFTLLFCFSLLLFRFDHNDIAQTDLVKPRHLKNMSLGAIGFVWALALYLEKTVLRNFAANASLKVIAFCFMLNWSYNVHLEWQVGKRLKDSYPDLLDRMRTLPSTKTLPPIVMGAQEDVDLQLQFLKENRLNIFRDDGIIKVIN